MRSHLTRPLAAVAVAVAMIGAAPAGAVTNHAPRAHVARTPHRPVSGGLCGEVARLQHEVQRRQATLDSLVASLRRAPDPAGLNGPQIAALENARAGIGALGSQVAGAACTPGGGNERRLHALGGSLMKDFRIYTLRVPQTGLLRAYDHLAVAGRDLARARALPNAAGLGASLLGVARSVAALTPGNWAGRSFPTLRSAWRTFDAATGRFEHAVGTAHARRAHHPRTAVRRRTSGHKP